MNSGRFADVNKLAVRPIFRERRGRMINVSLHRPPPSRHALDIREHYERKLERANNLYMELSAIMLQLEVREKELMKYVEKCFVTKVINLFHDLV